MIVNKKFDRLKQWGRERMGGEVKTDTTDEFKSLETEMQLRQEGMERLQRSTNAYIKSISKRDQGEDKEKQLPIAYFGTSMVSHGDDFEPDSEFGQCLSTLGRANERIARMQETYCANAASSWLESLERSLVQMKEYQAARRKLEQRRLAYDTASLKMQKSKKEDFRVEEELRSQKAKYEESSEDVYRRMLDIKEAEVDSVADLSSFLDAELTYYDRCREVLMQLKRDWPAQYAPNRSSNTSPVNGSSLRRNTDRSRNNSITADRFRSIAEDEPLEPLSRPTISSRLPSGQNSPRREMPGFDFPAHRPATNRSVSGFEGPTSLNNNHHIPREHSPAAMPRLTRVPTDPTMLLGARSNLRIAKREAPGGGGGDVFGDEQGDHGGGGADTLPAPSPQFEHVRTASWSQQQENRGVAAPGGKKGPPPPPPPSRAKKPPPPAPPLKRSALSTSEVPQY